MEIWAIYNPTTDSETREEARSRLEQTPHRVTWLETTRDDPGIGQARHAVESSADVVIAIGGDGTVRACAQGMIETEIPLAVVPAGTGNLIASNLGLPMNVEDAIDVAIDGRRRLIDTGSVEDETFVVMAGAGLDAIIMDRTASEAKERFGSLAYVLEAARNLDHPSVQATVNVDGSPQAYGAWALLLVGNLGKLQGGVEVFPEASFDDGTLQILGIAADSRWERMVAGVEVLIGQEDEHHFRSGGRQVEFELESDCAYELDGEPREPRRKLHFEARHRSLKICVPDTQ